MLNSFLSTYVLSGIGCVIPFNNQMHCLEQYGGMISGSAPALAEIRVSGPAGSMCVQRPLNTSQLMPNRLHWPSGHDVMARVEGC